MRSFLSISGIFAFFIIMFVIFAWILFPSAMVAKIAGGVVNKNLEKEKAPFRVSVENSSPVFPLGLELRNIRIYHNLEEGGADGRNLQEMQRTRRIAGVIDTAVIHPDLISIWGDRKRFTFEGEVHKGRFNGELNWIKNGKGPDHAPLTIKVIIEDVRLEQIPYMATVSDQISNQITGTINGESKGPLRDKEKLSGASALGGRLSADVYFEDRGPFGAVEAEIRVSNGALNIPVPVMNLGDVRFKDFVARISLKNRLFALKEAVLLSNIKNKKAGDMSGTARLKHPLKFSSMEFSGVLDPSALFGKGVAGSLIRMMVDRSKRDPEGYPFTITGTPAKPEFVFK